MAETRATIDKLKALELTNSNETNSVHLLK
jgi:hypothetical protein